MRRLLALVAAGAVSLAMAAPALSDTRVQVFPSQNPTSTEQNSNARFARVSVGSFERDAFGQSGGLNATTGAYANLTIAPGTGLFVTVAPSSSTIGAGTIYQMGQNDPNPLPTGGFSPALPPDTTNVLLAGQQTTTTSPLGPLTAPGAGNSVYYLIESQLVSQDGNSQSLAFVSSTGTKTFKSVPTNRVDAIVYQLKAGSAGTSPAKPTTDTGWLPVGYVLVPNGKTQILTGDITMSAPFMGFVQNASVVHVSPVASPTPDTGNAAITGQSAANQLVSTVATGTAPLIVASTTQVANLNAATAGTISPAPTPTAAAPITLTGTWPNQTIACATCVTGVTGTGNVSVTAGTAPVVTFTAAPTFNNVTISNTLTLSALASGCLQVNGSGVTSTTTCGGSGGISAVTGTAPITSTGGSTPAIGCSTCVVLNPSVQQTGTISVSGTITSGSNLAALVGSNKTTTVIERFISSTLTVAASVAFPLPSTATGFTVAATSFQCTTPGTSGTNTVQWQYTTTGDPTSASWTSITGAAQSWTTAGGTVPSTFTGFSLTGVSATWVRANVTAVGAGPPSNCYLYLHGTQTIK